MGASQLKIFRAIFASSATCRARFDRRNRNIIRYGGFLVPEKYHLFERFEKNSPCKNDNMTRRKKCFEAMPFKWINQSRGMGSGQPDV